MTHGRIVIVAAALLTLTACSEHSPTAPTVAALADRGAAANGLAGSPVRPFGGRCDTAFTFIPSRAIPPTSSGSTSNMSVSCSTWDVRRPSPSKS